MLYLFGLGSIALLALATAAIYAVLRVSAEMDELVDQRRKQREQR